MSLRDDLRLSYVPRWQIMPMLRTQSVSDHSWRVAIIAKAIVERMGYVQAKDVVYAAMVHDLDEVYTGDIPATVKEYSPSWVKSVSDVYLVVKLADYLEALSWVTMWGHETVVMSVTTHINPKYMTALGELFSRFITAHGAIAEVRKELFGGENADSVPSNPA